MSVAHITENYYKIVFSHSLWIASFFQNVCQILWCSVNGSCRSKLDSPIDGTRCGPEKVNGASSFVLLVFGFYLPERRAIAQRKGGTGAEP